MSDKDSAIAAGVEAAKRMIATERQWPVTLKLHDPVDFGDEQVTQLVFRRGRMGDLKGMTTGDIDSIDKLMMIASRMCQQPVAMLQLLSEQDGGEVLDIAMGFFARSLLGGKKL